MNLSQRLHRVDHVLDRLARDHGVERAVGKRDVLNARNRPRHTAAAVSHAATTELDGGPGEISSHEQTRRAERVHQTLDELAPSASDLEHA